MLSAVHHHLLRSANRTKIALVVEAGDVREVHHVAVLIGYGASAVNPYLAMESVRGAHPHRRRHRRHARGGRLQPDQGPRQGRAEDHVQDGHLHGGLLHAARRRSRRWACPRTSWTSTSPAPHSQLGGVGLDVIAAEVAARHAMAYPEDGVEQPHRPLLGGGEYQWRRDGEPHLFNPETVFRLQHATRERRYDIFKDYTQRRRRPVREPDDPARSAQVQGRPRARRCRSRRWSRSPASSSGSPPAR